MEDIREEWALQAWIATKKPQITKTKVIILMNLFSLHIRETFVMKFQG